LPYISILIIQKDAGAGNSESISFFHWFVTVLFLSAEKMQDFSPSSAHKTGHFRKNLTHLQISVILQINLFL
jgi:hypothetical protein